MPPKGASRTDKFSNIARIAITMSAPNVLSFQRMYSGVSQFEKVCWVIHRIEYFLTVGMLAEMTVDADEITMALTTTDAISALNTEQSSVLDIAKWQKLLTGTVVSEMIQKQPTIHDFGSLPGGGLIVVPAPLYLAMDTAGLASAGVASMRIRFTWKTLKAEEYWELVESTRIIT